MKDVIKELVGWIVSILLIVAVSYLIVTFVGQRTQVSGSSMETTLSDGDHLIVDKISYRFREPQRYEIVVFPYRYEKNTYYIKRIIGLPGETIQIKDGQILIDGETYQEDGGFPAIENAGVAETKVTLGNGEYFVLGDNRNNSEDSRYADMGNVKKRNIIGKVWFIASPWSRFGFV